MSRLWVALILGSGCAVESATGTEIAIVTIPAGLRGEPMLKEVAASFYAAHVDQHDMLVLWASRSIGGSAYYLPVANDVRGIGYGRVGTAGETFSRSAEFSSAQLQGMVYMGNAWPNTRVSGGHDSLVGLLAQETGHRWAASVYYRGQDGQDQATLVGHAGVHWSFFLAGNSPLGGNDWVDLGDGRQRATPGEPAYSALDLYLMGLVPAQDVAPIRLLADVEGCPAAVCAPWGPTSVEIEVTARVEEISIDQIIAAEGPRAPPAGDAPTVVGQAWIYVQEAGDETDLDAIDDLEQIRVAWEASFTQLTGGRGTVRTEL